MFNLLSGINLIAVSLPVCMLCILLLQLFPNLYLYRNFLVNNCSMRSLLLLHVMIIAENFTNGEPA